MEKPNRPRVSEETFDEFLARQGLLAACEMDAIKEIIANRMRFRNRPGKR